MVDTIHFLVYNCIMERRITEIETPELRNHITKTKEKETIC